MGPYVEYARPQVRQMRLDDVLHAGPCIAVVLHRGGVVIRAVLRISAPFGIRPVWAKRQHRPSPASAVGAEKVSRAMGAGPRPLYVRTLGLQVAHRGHWYARNSQARSRPRPKFTPVRIFWGPYREWPGPQPSSPTFVGSQVCQISMGEAGRLGLG